MVAPAIVAAASLDGLSLLRRDRYLLAPFRGYAIAVDLEVLGFGRLDESMGWMDVEPVIAVRSGQTIQFFPVRDGELVKAAAHDGTPLGRTKISFGDGRLDRILDRMPVTGSL